MNGIPLQSIEQQHCELISELINHARELSELKGQLFLQKPSDSVESIDLASRTILLSWPDIGIMMACHGYNVSLSLLQNYFIEVFRHHEASHHSILNHLYTKSTDYQTTDEKMQVSVGMFAKLFYLHLTVHQKRKDIIEILESVYSCNCFDREKLERLIISRDKMASLREQLVDILTQSQNNVAEPPSHTLQVPSALTSRKSSEALLGIHSNGFSIRLEKEDNHNSEERDLHLEAKKSSQHIINTHGRSEEVAIQHVRMRTHIILQQIATMGTMRTG